MKDSPKEDLPDKQETGNNTAAPEERRRESRRKKEARGYTYISMVGWMDRREMGRRTNDLRRYDF